MLKDQCIMLQEGGFEAKPHIQALMSSSSSSSYSVSAHTQQQQQQQAQQGPAALRALVKPNAAEQEVLKCPRCDSTNTKFCYYNNYSLTQPRHFCKTCRRYWTKGGSLRSVPVGGGCRKNSKRSTPTSSNSGNCGLIKNRNGDQVNMGQPSHTSFLATTTAQSHLAEVSSCYNGVDPELGIMNFVGLRAQQPPAHTQPQVDEHLFVGSSNNVFEGFQPYHLSHNLTALQSLQSQFLGASESMNGLPQTGNYRGLINTTAELSLVAHDTTPQSHQSHEVYNPYLNISLDQPSLDVRATNTRNNNNNNNGIPTSTNNFEPPHYWNVTTTSAAPSWPPTDFSAYGFSGLNPSSM